MAGAIACPPILAVGGVSGALLSMLRRSASFALLPRSALVFAAGLLLAALAPTFWLFAASLIVIGIATLTFLNASNALMQLSTGPGMRGRVLAIRLAVSLGGSAIGAPLVGWLANDFGPRVALGVAAIAGLSAALCGSCYSSSWIRRRLS